MLQNADTLQYIASMSGKPVIVIYNNFEDKTYFYLSNSFSEANPGNHIYSNSLQGCDLSSILTSIQGYAHNFDHSNEISINAKLTELPIIKLSFSDFKWIKIMP